MKRTNLNNWMRRTNLELYERYSNPSVMPQIKSRWLGHVERLLETNAAKKILKVEVVGMRRREHSRKKCIDAVKEDFKQLNTRDWNP